MLEKFHIFQLFNSLLQFTPSVVYFDSICNGELSSWQTNSVPFSLSCCHGTDSLSKCGVMVCIVPLACLYPSFYLTVCPFLHMSTLLILFPIKTSAASLYLSIPPLFISLSPYHPPLIPIFLSVAVSHCHSSMAPNPPPHAAP